jgi:hypothetical protein
MFQPPQDGLWTYSRTDTYTDKPCFSLAENMVKTELHELQHDTKFMDHWIVQLWFCSSS